MSAPSLVFPRRALAWGAALAAALCVCLCLTVIVRRQTSGTVRDLASVELTATNMRARQFAIDLDTLHDALLKLGRVPAAESASAIRDCRERLSEWLGNRLTVARGGEEGEILGQLSAESRDYFSQLDQLANRPGGLGSPIDRSTLAALDERASRLRSLVGNYAATHDDALRSLLSSSLGSVLWMRNLVFVCVALLLAAIGGVVSLLYREVVRPLRGQLIESEKLAALGTLAAGVAHEIRNPLTAMKARLYTLRRSVDQEDAKSDVQAITLEVDRLERIVRDVLGYARPAEPALGRVELSAWLREFAAFVQPEVSARRIELSVEADAAVEVNSDANQLQQILLNLVRNAEEAIDGRPGRITLSLQRERGQVRGKVGDVAVLAVTDDGPGIPPKVQARLFDPFFTTKPSGTGLGLSIVARLVQNQGGEIAFQSTPRTGTRFAVRLPAGAGALPPEPS